MIMDVIETSPEIIILSICIYFYLFYNLHMLNSRVSVTPSSQLKNCDRFSLTSLTTFAQHICFAYIVCSKMMMMLNG